MAKQMGAPFWESGFYFHDLTEQEALQKTLQHLMSGGAKILDPVLLKQDNIQRIPLIHAVGTVTDTQEILTFGTISAAAKEHDHRSIALYADGTAFLPEEVMDKTDKERARRAAKTVYRTFKDIVQQTNPAYAAMFIEDYLPCPYDLAHGVYSSLSDFFLSSSVFSQEQIEAAKTTFVGAYIEDVGNGVFISTYKYFNPALKKSYNNA
ncbi:MAG: hypothetical protein AAF787_12690, partial [Chloroflexota bacterium]